MNLKRNKEYSDKWKNAGLQVFDIPKKFGVPFERVTINICQGAQLFWVKVGKYDICISPKRYEGMEIEVSDTSKLNKKGECKVIKKIKIKEFITVRLACLEYPIQSINIKYGTTLGKFLSKNKLKFNSSVRINAHVGSPDYVLNHGDIICMLKRTLK